MTITKNKKTKKGNEIKQERKQSNSENSDRFRLIKKCKSSKFELDIECLVNEYKEQHEKMNLRELMSSKDAVLNIRTLKCTYQIPLEQILHNEKESVNSMETVIEENANLA